MPEEKAKLREENEQLRALLRPRKRQPWSLLFMAGLALFMVGVVLYAQFYFSKRADDALCTTLISLVERSSESLKDHPYYKRNPQDLPAALKQNQETLAELRNACPE